MFTSESLQDLLNQSCGRQPYGIAVNIFCSDKNSVAHINASAQSEAVSIGCITKLLTATLVAIAQTEGKLELESAVSEYFPEILSINTQFPQIQIGHLLNHTHGFDHSTLPALVRKGDCSIDTDVLLDAIKKTKILAPPGIIYNYNSVGSWLAAAILEQVYGLPYFELLQELVFTPLGIVSMDIVDPSQVCPAGGQDLKLSAQDLMTLALFQMYGDPARPHLNEILFSLRSKFSFRLPEVALTGENVCPGWFDFGGSYGHFGYGKESAAAIRILPSKEIAIVVTAKHKILANTAMAILFRELLPDFKRNRLPSFLNADEWSRIDTRNYRGLFENDLYTLDVDTTPDGVLQTKVHLRKSNAGATDVEPQLGRRYRAAAGDYFIPVTPEPQVCPTLYFSHLQSDGKFRFVSTGTYVFARVK